jgi:uncharacterized caspase-like protein
MIHTKVNTEATDVAMKSSSTSDGLTLQLDLTAAGGFPFKSGRNSVELEFEDQFGRAKYYNFLLDFQPADSAGRFSIEKTPAPSSHPTTPETTSGKLLAVVIGISHYQDTSGDIPDLQYADKDAEAMAQFLKSPAGGSIADENLDLLLNDQATIENVRHALFTFLTKAQPEDTVIIYMAGHGAPDPNDPRNLYFITTDSKLHDMGGTAFPMWQMQDVFARILKARKVITLVDACHSYGFTGNRNGDPNGYGNNLFNQYLQSYASGGERAVITASDISQVSYEDQKWGGGHGVFTWYLLRGLHGDADSNHDGIVTAGELFQYLQRTVPAATADKQTPRAMEGMASSLILSSTLKHHAQREPRPANPALWSALSLPSR